MIEVEGVWKTYGSRTALAGVTFTAADGAITGLLGANGAGKTTTFGIIGGLMCPDRGCVRIDGAPTGDRGDRPSMGILPHVHGLYGRLTVREHLAYFGALRGCGDPGRAASETAMARARLDHLANRRADALSQGERVRVGLACAMVHEPRNLVLDEPTSGLDVLSVRALHDDLRRLRDEGVSILFSTHVMSEAAALCDRIVILAAGRVTADGPPRELARAGGHEDLESLFVSVSS